MIRRGVKIGFLGLALAFAVALAAPAFALGATAPVANGALDVQAWAENNTLVVVSALTVPSNVQLPVTVRIPVPADAQVQWAGEVLGGDPNADPSRKYTIKKSPVGGSYAEFTIETTRVAQVDAFLPVLKTSGSDVSAAFEWVQSVSSPTTSISIRTPAGAGNVKIAPAPSGAPATNADGETLYAGSPIKLTPGSNTPVSLSYTIGAAHSPGATPAASNSSALYFALAMLIAVLVVLAIVLVRQRGAVSAPPRPGRGHGGEGSKTADDSDSSDASATTDEDDWGFSDDD